MQYNFKNKNLPRNTVKTIYDKDEFYNYDNFYTLIKNESSNNMKIYIIYGHFFKDDENLFLYRKYFNNKIQDNKTYKIQKENLYHPVSEEYYKFYNLEDVLYVYNEIKSSNS